MAEHSIQKIGPDTTADWVSNCRAFEPSILKTWPLIGLRLDLVRKGKEITDLTVLYFTDRRLGE